MSTLGIDTSNYTTSIALSDGLGAPILDLRRLLKVGKGALGLRQSDAFYQHIANLRIMIEPLKPHYESITEVVVSTQPRNVPDSYMPVFNAGVFFAQTLGLSDKITITELSHQEGHLLSGYHPDLFQHQVFHVLHISGGTTEWLRVERAYDRFRTEILDHTLDLSFGQLVDRIGQHMGLPFPSGQELDRLSTGYRHSGLKQVFRDGGFNLSGMENKFKQEYDRHREAALTADLLFSYLCELIDAMIARHDPNLPLLVVGGVGENRIIRSHFADKSVYFTPKGLSSDNAVGLSRYPAVMEALCD